MSYLTRTFNEVVLGVHGRQLRGSNHMFLLRQSLRELMQTPYSISTLASLLTVGRLFHILRGTYLDTA